MTFILGIIIGGIAGVMVTGLSSANSWDDGYRQAIQDMKNTTAK